MRNVDLKSLAIAGAIGALALMLYEEFSSEPKLAASDALQIGFVIGASVQFALRLSGVS